MVIKEDYDFLGWAIPAVVGAGSAMWALGKRLFASVTRDELESKLDDWQNERYRMHEANSKRLDEIDKILRAIVDRVGHIEGSMSGRFPRPREGPR
jgi:hypothetical protein